MSESLLAKLDEVLCPNNRILGLMKRIQQALSPSGSTSTTSEDQGEVIRSVDTDDILDKWDEVLLQLKRTHLHLFLISGFDGIELDPVLILKPKRHKPLPLEDDDLAALLHVRDVKSQGTAGGNSSGATWNVRDLNTVLTNEITGASLASNQITLAAGTYEVTAAEAPAFQVRSNRLRLRDTTGTATLILGVSAAIGASTLSASSASLRGRFTLTVESVLELQHFTFDAETNGLGTAVNTAGIDEIYADIMIKRIS